MRISTLLLVVGLSGVRGAEAAPVPFDGSRAALEIPDEVWNRVLESGGRAGGVIGYTTDEMKDFGKDAHLLRTVQGLFRDVRKIPRETGRITDGLLDNAAKPSEVIARGYALTDIHAGRMYEPPKESSWGLPQLENAETAEAALRVLSDKVEGDLAAVPPAALRLLVRLCVAREVALPWLYVAHRGLPELARSPLLSLVTTSIPPARDLHEWVRRPWVDEARGQSATSEPESIQVAGSFSRTHMAYASVLLAVHLERAIHEYRTAPLDERTVTGESSVVIRTPRGRLWIGTGTPPVPDPIEPENTIVLDLAGDDRPVGRIGASWGGSSPISLHVDLDGNDTYRSEGNAHIACGLFGIGVLVDLAGDDVYDAGRSGLGCGCFGTGLLWDLAGNDAYRSRGPWGQGCGHVGVGALIDLEGDDEYDCVEQAQGLGGTLGAGLLIDVQGNDTYLARDDGNVSALYLGQSVAMAQGCGYGRRADIGDGLSLAGGVGVLVDGAGDDRYHAEVWAQGCAYWWGLGILEDRGGNDNYRNGKYSAGAAAHFAIGVCVDLAGDDVHNVTNTTAKNQFQGHARDGSIGVFVDGDGDDTYDVTNHCAGAADLNSIGLFWDRRGDDTYTFHDTALGPANGWNDTGAFGVASRYAPFRSFRDDLPSWGLFLDTGGTDVYAVEDRPKTFTATPAKDDSHWKTQTGPLVWGLGWDVAHYPASARR